MSLSYCMLTVFLCPGHLSLIVSVGYVSSVPYHVCLLVADRDIWTVKGYVLLISDGVCVLLLAEIYHRPTMRTLVDS